MKASLQLFPSSNKPEVVAGRVANHSKQCTWGNRKAPQHPQKPQACTPTLQILALKLAIAKPREAELPLWLLFMFYASALSQWERR